MRLSFLPPPPDLQDLVLTYWRLDPTASAPALPEDPHRVLPDGCPELIVHFGKPFGRRRNGKIERDPQAFVFGQLEGCLDLSPTANSGTLGARLHASALGRLTGTAAHRLTGRAVSLEDLWGREGALWTDRLLDCSDLQEALDALDDGLRRLWRSATVDSHQTVETAVAEIFHRRGTESVANLSRRVGYSTRHLERLFKEHVGISPKSFTRIIRFHSIQRYFAHEKKHALPQTRSADVALDFGFSDQAHMIREFRAFAHTTPAAFANSESQANSSLWLLRGDA